MHDYWTQNICFIITNYKHFWIIKRSLSEKDEAFQSVIGSHGEERARISAVDDIISYLRYENYLDLLSFKEVSYK